MTYQFGFPSARTRKIEDFISKAFNNRDLADVTVYIGPVELPAHSLILACQSAYFKAALTGGFKESTTKEFRYDEGSFHAYWRVFQFIYTGTYSEGPEPTLNTPDDSNFLKDIQVCVLGDYFSVDGLQEFALRRLRKKLEDQWKKDSFADCIREIYASTGVQSHSARAEVVKIVKDHMKELWTKPSFQELIHEGGDFVVELMQRFATG